MRKSAILYFIFTCQLAFADITFDGFETKSGLITDRNSDCYKHYGAEIPEPIIKPSNVIKIDISDVVKIENLGESEDTLSFIINGSEGHSISKLNVGETVVDFVVTGEGEVHAWHSGIAVNDELVFEHKFLMAEAFSCSDEIYRYRLIFDVTNKGRDVANKTLDDALKKAKMGDSESQATAGKIYLDGVGTESVSEAVVWFTKAAEQGNVYSQFILGYIYSQNPAVYPQVKPDSELAVYWYTKASEQGDLAAKNNLALMYGDPAIVNNLLRAGDKSASMQNGLERLVSGKSTLDSEGEDNKFDNLIPLAEKNDANAQFMLGLIFEYGQGDKQDCAQAIEWYRKSADNGYAVAQTNLGLIYFDGCGANNNYRRRTIRRDYKAAFDLWSKAANQGYAPAQQNLGLMYHFGYGVDKDYKQAFDWYSKAVEQGDVNALNNLAYMYFNAQGLEKNYKKAFDLYSLAAEKGLAISQFELGMIYLNGYGIDKDFERGMSFLSKSAEQGYILAQRSMGEIYENQSKSHEAINWYHKAAKGGDAVSANKLRLVYFKESIRLLIEASADQKTSAAKNNLDNIFSSQRSITSEDGYPSYNWWIKPAESGDVKAQYIVGVIFENFEINNTVKKDYKKAIDWYTKSANQGYAPAQNNLGMMYFKALGVGRDDGEAVKWWTKAAEQQNPDAKVNLGLMYLCGLGVDIDHKKAYLLLDNTKYRGFAFSGLSENDLKDMGLNKNDSDYRRR